MKTILLLICGAVGSIAAIPAAFSAEANAGRSLFRQRCSVCHTAESGDNGGAQGSSLIGVLGRPAAGPLILSTSSIE